MQRTALVTGATAGFGAAICRTLIENGYRVIGTGRRVARLEQLQQELGENFHFLAFDISDSQATEDAFHSLPANWQSIDLLVKMCIRDIFANRTQILFSSTLPKLAVKTAYRALF